MGPGVVFWAVLALASAVYGGLLGWLSAGIRRARRNRARSPATPDVSIVVAARNEEQTIGACLEALRRQQYDGALQIVVVDDRSTDGTALSVRQMAALWPAGVTLCVVQAPQVPRYRCPKKSALAAGIEASTGEWLLFTDADCRPPVDWVRRMVAHGTDGVGLVAGFACVEPLTGWRERLLAVDNLGVSALAEGSIGMGAALSCTGRSLAYRQQVDHEVGGFDAIGHLLSGDDVYFLRLVATQTDWGIRYCADIDAVVLCEARGGGWSDVLQQKLRHASKAARYGGAAAWLGLGVYAYHALLAAGLVHALTVSGSAAFWLAWVGRWLADAAVLWQAAPRGRQDRVLLTFLPAVELLYLPYVLVFVPLGRAGWFRWRQDSGPALTDTDSRR